MELLGLKNVAKDLLHKINNQPKISTPELREEVKKLQYRQSFLSKFYFTSSIWKN